MSGLTDEEREKLRHMIAAIEMLVERVEELEKMVGKLEWQIRVLSGGI